MGKLFDKISSANQQFIQDQKIFFVATAPNQGGRVNVSPKGMNTFRVFNEKEVGYLDLTGSGNETAAHIAENGRLTIMFCSFTEKPMILRLSGKGRVLHPNNPEWNSYLSHFEQIAGMRQIILLEVEMVQTSCGMSIPFYSYEGERRELEKWAQNKGETGLKEYWAEKNTESLDGLPTFIPVD
jgi:hypothetical protein